MALLTQPPFSKHNKPGDLVSWNSFTLLCRTLTITQWVIIDSDVYDISKFAELHPGGRSVLLDEEIGVVFSCFSHRLP